MGPLTGGMAYEALNNAARLNSNFIIVLNDNNMSISENVGGMSAYLGDLRTSEAYTGLKLEVTNTLNKIPVYGERLVQTNPEDKERDQAAVYSGHVIRANGTYLPGAGGRP